ncbi:Vesicle-fusing ATPase [Camellia lanceoleosa]|uniref:Vesicle-fusing ATPase n=1 Tax=Camellia lanceoleosa TaxID=1840588 RepID=A0ACC0HRA5_9ERIC|nr:Vesicle-fusing ATPase [Camellia lanceoleosa]
MASSSSTPFVVENTSSEQRFTNLRYCCPEDLNQFAHRKSLDVSLGGTILCQVFAPPPNGFDMDVLRILLELLSESSTPTPTVFTEYQRAVFAYKRNEHACRVVEISLGESEGSESLRNTKQAMIRKHTKVIVEVPQSLAIHKNLQAFQIDGLKVLNNIFIIATINRKELIDEALLREGRIELHVKLEYPDEQGRLQILEINTRNMRQAIVLNKDVKLKEIDGCSGSTITSLVTRAHSYAVVQAGERGLVKHVQKDVKVTMNHFLHAIEDIKFGLQESGLEPCSFFSLLHLSLAHLQICFLTSSSSSSSSSSSLPSQDLSKQLNSWKRIQDTSSVTQPISRLAITFLDSANEELERRCRQLYFPSSHGNALLSPSGDCDGEQCCRAGGGEVFQPKIFDSCFGDEFEGGGNGRIEKRKVRSNESEGGGGGDYRSAEAAIGLVVLLLP